jgi:DNA-binding NarL/FixJ family response regulator
MNEALHAERIRLVLVHDHALFRESVARLLAAEPGFELVAECIARADTLEALSGTDVDVVLLGLRVSREEPDDLISAAQHTGFRGNFLVIASELDAAGSAAALRRGASGIFLESGSSAHLMQAIRLVASGYVWIDQSVVRLLADRYPHHEDRCLASLTDREQKVLKGVLEGLTSKRIGDQIGTSESTIKAILQQLFDKAGVRTRSQLVRAALEGMMKPEPRS